MSQLGWPLPPFPLPPTCVGASGNSYLAFVGSCVRLTVIFALLLTLLTVPCALTVLLASSVARLAFGDRDFSGRCVPPVEVCRIRRPTRLGGDTVHAPCWPLRPFCRCSIRSWGPPSVPGRLEAPFCPFFRPLLTVLDVGCNGFQFPFASVESTVVPLVLLRG